MPYSSQYCRQYQPEDDKTSLPNLAPSNTQSAKLQRLDRFFKFGMGQDWDGSRLAIILFILKALNNNGGRQTAHFWPAPFLFTHNKNVFLLTWLTLTQSLCFSEQNISLLK